MKKISIVLALLFSVAIFAQSKILQGKITSIQTMSSDDENINERFQSMGAIETVTYYKALKSRSETKNPMSGDVVTIIDGETQNILMFMDNPMLGKKYSLSDGKLSEEDSKLIKVVKGDRTKKILGYDCQQYKVTVNKSGLAVEMELFTTEEIPAKSSQIANLGNKISGFPMYMKMKINQ